MNLNPQNNQRPNRSYSYISSQHFFNIDYHFLRNFFQNFAETSKLQSEASKKRSNRNEKYNYSSNGTKNMKLEQNQRGMRKTNPRGAPILLVPRTGVEGADGCDFQTVRFFFVAFQFRHVEIGRVSALVKSIDQREREREMISMAGVGKLYFGGV